MSFFLQMSCSDAREIRDGCIEFKADLPQTLVGDTIADIVFAKRLLERQAKQDSWVRKRKGWICPFCASLDGGGS